MPRKNPRPEARRKRALLKARMAARKTAKALPPNRANIETRGLGIGACLALAAAASLRGVWVGVDRAGEGED